MLSCFNCNNIIDIEMSKCPFCGATVNKTKYSFLDYIGPDDSLTGYQKSYKLVLLKSILENLNENDEALTSDVISDVRSFYMRRYENGFLTDVNVDPRIANIQNSSDYDVFVVMRNHPYKVINEKGFLFINRNKTGELVFLFNEDILPALNTAERNKLLQLLNCKLELYYHTRCPGDAMPVSVLEKKNDQHNQTPKDLMISKNTKISDILMLSSRAKNLLMRNRIFTVDDLVTFALNNDLKSLKNMGSKTLGEIKKLLENLKCEEKIEEEPLFDNLKISEVFSENKYNKFRDYCSCHSMEYIVQLKDFDFNLLLSEDGIGVSKVRAIRDKYEYMLANYVNNKDNLTLKSDPVSMFNIHQSNLRLSLEALRIVGVSQKTINELSEIGLKTLEDINTLSMDNDLKILRKARGKENIDNIKKYEQPLTVVLKDCLEKLNDEKGFNVYIDRSDGMTLQEISEKLNITRERVRQIEKKYRALLQPLVERIVENYLEENSVDYIKTQTISQILQSSNFDKVITHTLLICERYEYFYPGQLFIRKTSPNQDTMKRLRNLARSFVGEGINLYDKLDTLDDFLTEEGFKYIDADTFIDVIIESGAKFYGDYVTFDRKSYGYVCAEIAGEYFKDGIDLNSDDDLNKLRDIVHKKIGAIKLPQNNHAFSARLSGYLIKCDKKKSTVARNISVDFGVLENIKRYIDEVQKSTIYYSEIFSEFEGLLCMTTGITNQYCLHGVLSYYYPKEYKYSKDYLSKVSPENCSFNVSDQIAGIIAEAGCALNKQEVMKRLGLHSDMVIIRCVNNNRRLMQWDINYFNCTDNLDINNEEKENLNATLENLMGNMRGYCSSQMLYAELNNSMTDFIRKNNIRNASNLFYVCEMLFGTKYDFRAPHICQKGLFDKINTKTVAMYFMDNTEKISYHKFMDLANKLYWSQTTMYFVFSEIEDEYIQISEDEYVLEELICLNDYQIREISGFIKSRTNDLGILPLIRFDDFEGLPDINYEWNAFLLASLTKIYDLGYKAISINCRARHYMKDILVRADLPYDTYDQIVVETMRRNGISHISEKDFLGFLVINHLAVKNIPNELFLSEALSFDKGYFSLKE